ncbi:MAG: hypothetical protein ACPGU7_09645 [Gammaproteobacteria bacterium]
MPRLSRTPESSGRTPPRAWRIALLFLFAMQPLGALAQQSRIDTLLAAPEPPSGVVFDIIEGSGAALAPALDRVSTWAKALRTRFPALPMAIVSHGSEQFALMSENRDAFRGAHERVLALGSEDDIPVHVCAVHASWRERVPEDFPDYVDVADSGPAQIGRYQELDWEVVQVD